MDNPRTLPPDNMIHGVTIKKVTRHKDKDGFFAELVKSGEETFHEILQTSYCETEPGVIKAWHSHSYWEIWCVIKGEAKVVLYDMRPNSPTHGKSQLIHTGEDNMLVIAIPSKVAHGYKVIGKKKLGIIYHSARAYNPKRVAIKEIPFDDPGINFDWSKL